ncbi:fatty acid amide hydrolase [Pelomyxa schiedti]|nr:fatty acid amide hydrolase [Pelomyxa schiedti]
MQTNMIELGFHGSGHNSNPRYAHGRNPYSLKRDTGGSSSGSAIAVSAGICPVALGFDGGGSVRIPAASCGVVGLKPTTGRISSWGDMLCSGGTLGVIGPIAGNARDCAIILEALSGEDIQDPMTFHAPPFGISNMRRENLAGLTIGVYSEWFNDSTAPVKTSCREFLKYLENQGARLKEIQIPYLKEGQVAHMMMLGAEIVASRGPSHGSREWKNLNPSTRTMESLVNDLTTMQLISAAKIKYLVSLIWEEVFRKVDIMVTPALGDIPAVGLTHASEDALDVTRNSIVAKYMYIPNFTGLPAIVFPIDYHTTNGELLPVGIQMIGPVWTEDLLIRTAELCAKRHTNKKPVVYYNILAKVESNTE